MALRRRSAAVLVVTAALLVAVGAWGALMLASSSTARPKYPTSPDDGPLTPRQYALAVRLVTRAVTIDQAHLATATAVVRSGVVVSPNQGGMCRSGRLVEIRLTGRFPDIGANRLPGDPRGPVTSVDITADGVSGRSCRLVLGVGKAAPYHHAANLLPALVGRR